MKKLLILGALGLGLLALSKPPAFTIKGRIEGDAAKGKKVYLMPFGKYGAAPLDSTHIDEKGHFSFKGTAPTPRMLSLAIVTNPSGPIFREPTISLFVENSTIGVEAVYDSLLMEGKSVIALQGKLSRFTKIKGSKSHEQFRRFYEPRNRLDEERSRYFDQYVRYLNPPKGQQVGPVEEGIALAKKMDEVEKKRKDFTVGYILSATPSEVLAHIASGALGLGSIHVSEIEQLRQKFASLQSPGPLAKEFIQNAAMAQKTAVGSSLVDFTLYDREGKAHPLSEYVGKGRYTLVEFWASWCGPCRADIPKIMEAFHLYHPKGFDIVGVSLDEDKEKWTKAMKDESLTEWPQLIEPNAFKSELTATYRINGIPACLLFDPNGKLVTRNVRGSWMQAILIDLYGNLYEKKAAAQP